MYECCAMIWNLAKKKEVWWREKLNIIVGFFIVKGTI